MTKKVLMESSPVSLANDSINLITSTSSSSLTTEGHRARLLERFSLNGIKSLHDHEIIELVLTYALPRRDTKPIARKLLDRFKTVGGVLNASVEDLITIDGIGKRTALLFVLIHDVLAVVLQERFDNQDVVSHRNDVEAYMRFHYGYKKDEYVAVLFLNNANSIIKTDIVAEGTVNQCALYPRQIIERALHYGASSLIVAHNHPGGGTTPSEADWVITERIHSIGKLLEIPLLDHLLICRQTVISLREMPRWPQK